MKAAFPILSDPTSGEKAPVLAFNTLSLARRSRQVAPSRQDSTTTCASWSPFEQVNDTTQVSEENVQPNQERISR